MEFVNLDNLGGTQTTAGVRQTWFQRADWPRRFRSCWLPLLTRWILEATVIALVIGYLLFKFSDPQSGPLETEAQHPNAATRIYRNHGHNVSLMLNTIESCDQKLHDILFDVECVSSKPELCPVLVEDPTRAQIVVTSRAGDRLKTDWARLESVSCELRDSCRYKTVLEVDPSKGQQKILGWGGAMTDSSINNILSLSTNGTRRLLGDYFGPDGLRMNMVRVSIGGSDFSSRFYTNIDEPPDFRLTDEDILYKIPILRYIQREYGKGSPVKFFASMWSPPTWMKTNGHFNGGHLKGGIYYKKLAQLKRDFLLAYRNNSVNFWGLTVMNEPIFAVQPFLNFNTMIFPRDDYANYVTNYLGPMIRGDHRLEHLMLMAHDDNRRYLMDYTDKILRNTSVLRYIDGISTHGYIDEDYPMMQEIQAKYPKLFVLPTELCSGHLPFMAKATLGNWNRGVHYALDIIRGLQHSASGWVDWNMALDMGGGPGWLGGRLDSPVIVDKARDAYHKSPMFYVLGHFSRYIPEGSVKIDTSITNSLYDYHFETVTFSTPSGQLVTVVLNNNPYPVELYVRVMGHQSELRTLLVRCKADSVTTIVYHST